MYENMRDSKIISVDIESYDPDLDKKMGPGVYRSVPLDFLNANGYILGVSIVDEHNNKGYYDLGHYDCSQELRTKNIAYLKEVLGTNAVKIGANLQYDLDWLENWAYIKVNGPLIDVQVAEALLDEAQRHYNLDFMGKKYFGEQGGKAKDKLDRFCYDNGFKGDVRKYLWKMPHYLVEEYAIQDVDLPFNIWKKQEPMLEEQGLTDLMRLECDLLRVLLKMRKTGVRLDPVLRDKSSAELTERVESTHSRLKEQVGFPFNFRSTKHLAFILDEYGIPYPFTKPSRTYPDGQPSVKRDYLIDISKGIVEGSDGELIVDSIRTKLGTDLADLRRADKVLNTFINGSLVKFITKGNLIHCSFYPMMTDNYGTKSGRFSSANPNLQQIPAPARDAYYGGLSRAPFIPFEGCLWGKLDYSQIEYRFMAHYARGEGADEVRQRYNEDPRTDYHKLIQDLTGLGRPEAKTLNFGVGFGMGATRMAKENHWPLDHCYNLLHIYHKNAPYIKSTMSAVGRKAVKSGFIRTFLNRRARLTDPGLDYTMYNRLVQGSAADLMKKAMYDIDQAGIFDVLAPHLTVHDELDLSVPRTKEGAEAFKETKHIMETCIELKVPIVADMELGTNWSNVEEVKNLSKELGI